MFSLRIVRGDVSAYGARRKHEGHRSASEPAFPEDTNARKRTVPLRLFGTAVAKDTHGYMSTALPGWRHHGIRSCVEILSPTAGHRAHAPEGAAPHTNQPGATATFWALAPVARVYIGTVIVAGLAAVVYAIPRLIRVDPGMFSTLAILALLVSFAKINLRIPRSSATLSPSCIIDFTALLVLGVPAALMTAAVGAWTQCSFRVRKQTPPHQTWFSVGALTLAVLASARTYAFINTRTTVPPMVASSVAVFAASAAHFMVNSLLVALAVALSTRQQLWRVWFEKFAWIWPGYVAGFVLAAIAAASIKLSSFMLIPFAGLVLGLTYGTLKTYVEHSSDSNTDALTALPNRRYLMTHIARELARCSRERTAMSLMVIDLDEFKAINDVFGHAAGDQALCEVARHLQHSLRSYDVCARFGGDEFVAVLPGCNLEHAGQKAEALRRVIADVKTEVKPGVVRAVRISVGAATYPIDGATVDELLAVADARMFDDKRARRSQPRRATMAQDAIPAPAPAL